ncbi:hypothetical protein FACS1894199_12890 [Bacteroidia bacterium]|nr:hypothetical protein FACS1894199_12890 [Bacteroidia bacterium]
MNKTVSTQPTFESIMAIMDRTERRQEAFEKLQEKNAADADKRFREYDKRRKEESAEWHASWKKLEEYQAKVSKEISEMSKNLGGLGLRIGEIMETLLAAGSWEKFKEYNYDFERAYQRVGIYNGKARLTDVDILLSNGKYAMAVEVKNTLNRFNDVDDHVERLDLLMQYPPAEIKEKKVMGAMACGVVDDRVRDYAFSKGLFVLELTGDAADLATPPANFTPQEWIPQPSLRA